jgi:hypothetical protein
MREEKCGWCGAEIVGEPVSPFSVSEMVAWSGDKEVKLLPEYHCGFCSDGCAWAFGEKNEKQHGMKGKELKRHLEVEHGLVYASVSRLQSVECREYFEKQSRVVADWMLKQRIAGLFENRAS